MSNSAFVKVLFYMGAPYEGDTPINTSGKSNFLKSEDNILKNSKNKISLQEQMVSRYKNINYEKSTYKKYC